MTAAQWLAEHAKVRSDVAGFTCLEDCGFCCTYPPEVGPETFRAISETTGLKDIGVDENGTTYLPLQGGCGACVLLEDKRCQDYEHRPKHCRLFPFHIYFGRTIEVYTNRVCPGLDADDDAVVDLGEAIGNAVTTVVPGELASKREEALAVHEQFERNCKAAGTWRNVDEMRATAPAPVLTEEAWTVALAAFESELDQLLPTMVLPHGFVWRMWRHEAGTFTRITYAEDGTLTTQGRVAAPSRPATPSPVCTALVDRLMRYECFVGSAFDLVDASEYELDVEAAVAMLRNEMAAGITLREHLLQAEGVPVNARLIAASYEPEFYDLPTIGGWL